MVNYELYRRSLLGIALTDVLDEFIQKQLLSPALAIRTLLQFDRAMTEALNNRVRIRSTMKGHLHYYRNLDDVWTFIIENCVIKFEDKVINVDKVKIVACKKLD